MTSNRDRDSIIAALGRLGVELRDASAIHPDETDPFFILVAEREDGMAFAHVLNFDAEMIEEDDAYGEWVRSWARVTGKEHLLSDVASHVDFDGGTSRLSYVLDGRPVRMEFKQDQDWLDPDVAERVEADFGAVDGRARLYLDNGQGGVFVWVPEQSVDGFVELFPDAELR